MMAATPAIEGAHRALTDEQEQAVERRDRALLLSAAAGSGKTSVLVERFVRAVREDGVAPGRMLAITFTERAAGELRERVRARLLELGEREAARDTEAAFVGTFHGFCARLLRAHPLPAGLDPEFAILDEGLSGSLRERAFTVALRGFLKGEREDVVDLLGAYGVDRVQAMIEGVYAQLRSRGQLRPALAIAVPPAGSADALTTAALAACALLEELLGGFGEAYEQLKRERGSVDFDDLELLAGELLAGQESVRRAWSERFELMMVDEFQDSNPRQLAILAALDRGNLFTVGDEFQSIYSFRHADVGLFRDRREELQRAGASLALTHNFRSRPALLAVVNAVFDERFSAFTKILPARAGAEPEPGAGRGEPLVELLLTDKSGWEQADLAGEIAAGLPHAPLWRQAEARLLAQRVAGLIESGQARAGEVVVLLRALGDVEVYERALQLHGLSTLAAVGRFWEQQQVGDLLAYLRVLANPLDEEALYGALASPLVGLSRDGLGLLARAARAEERGAWETALAAGAHRPEGLEGSEGDALGAFCERVQGERAAAGQRTISELIERAIESSGYREHVLGLPSGERRLANVHKLLRIARRFEASEGRDLRGFLDHVARLQAAKGSPESYAPVEGGESDSVRLMSVHAAKGLEFEVVCVADLGRAPNTRMPDLLVDGERVGLALVGLDGQRSPALDYEDLCARRRRAEAEEEDRILYVAMTRARERLLLSGAIDFERFSDERQPGSMMSWLAPALVADPVELLQAPQRPWHDLPAGQGGVAQVRCLLNSPASVGAVLRMDRAAGAPQPAAPAPLAAAPSVQRPPAAAPEPAGSAAGGQAQERMATLSYTALSELERCGYRYYLERVLGLPEKAGAARAQGAPAGLAARARGQLVHALLELADFTRAQAPEPDQVAELARGLGMRVGAGEARELAGLIERALRSAPAARVAAAEGVRREYPFAFSLDAHAPLLVGVIDLLARERDGGSLVLDYKSDRVAAKEDLEALTEREYGLQRLLYALAVLRDGARSVEIVHWFLERPEEWVSARFQAHEEAELAARLTLRIGRARTGAYEVSGLPHRGLCETCPGRGTLCSYGDAETLRELPVAGAF